MLYDFKLPDIGEGVHEATILEWKTALGDTVEEGDVLAVVETDKVVAEIPSPRGGVIRKLGAKPDQSIRVGEILARIEVGGTEKDSPGESTSVVGTLESSSSTLLEASREGLPAVAAGSEQGKLKATPVARRLAAKEGIELASLQGSGPSGRILKEDILGEIQSRGNGSNRIDHQSAAPPGFQPSGGEMDRGETGPQQLSTLRRTVARNLEASWRIPAAVIHDFAVVDELVEARSALNRSPESSSHPKLSYLPFFVKAAAVGLKQYPLLNAWYDEQRQTFDPQHDANIGFALDSQAGLIVPVVDGADRLTLSEIQELIDLRRGEAANRELRVEHLRGGTFTLSNYGSIGGTYGRPLILPPQVAILGLGRIHQAPIAKDGQPTVAAVLPLSFVFDHRVCDGSYAVRFLNSFIELVSKPIRILR